MHPMSEISNTTTTARLHDHHRQILSRQRLRVFVWMTMIVSFRQCSRAFSPTRVVVLRQRSGTKSSFHSTTRIGLNRFLFDPAELGSSPFTDNENGQETVTVTLPKDDYRTIHAAKILGLHNGDTVRAGVVPV
mmetsp:Transcript_17824/g.33850  ORF Transcript_17824/g.33850 Transcript_17824/m.33850 type:complete len:133 (+) Transcript_17824:2900-3298(+)